MTSGNNRPQIGETLFVSLWDQKPFLTMVTSYHHDKNLGVEKFDYTRKGGRSSSTILSKATFYPGVPTDTAYIYVVVMEQSEFMEGTETTELGYFFDPKSAFDYMKAIETGKIKPRVKPSLEFVGYLVMVEEV